MENVVKFILMLCSNMKTNYFLIGITCKLPAIAAGETGDNVKG